ncbi:MAG: hypothetical protein GX330_08090 [Bacteroidales bacterium]|nr:hypothetical protein [Bacteroidales bacterium]
MKNNNVKKEATLSSKTPHSLSLIFKKILPHIAAIAVMYVLTFAYFSPVFFDEKDLPQGDMVSVQGMTQEVKSYQEKTGEYSEWTNSMFSGMPTATLWGKPYFNIFQKISVLFRGGLPLLHAGMMFTYLLCFYIFMLSIGANAWVSLLGAIVYAFASYNFIIIEAGHVTKGYAMAYIAPLIGGIILTFRKKYLLGALITLLFLGLEISSSHIQITYYAFIMVGAIGIAYFFYYLLKEKVLLPFFKATALLIVAAIFAVLPNLGNLLPTYTYSKDTMRGGSELTITPDFKNQEQNASTPNEGGLEIDYAFMWSYGKMETFTLLVPNLYGGGHVELDSESETMQALRQNGYGSSYLPTYWGEQPFTSGPVYAGAIVSLLFILGLFVVKGPEKWWVIAVFVISLVLAWGKNFEVINNFLFHYLPFYNKFRTPAMALIIAGVAMPILGMLGLKEIFSNNLSKEKSLAYLKNSYYVSIGLCVFLFLAVAMFFSFSGGGDAQYKQQLLNAGFRENNVNSILSILFDYRKSMAYKDIFRSIAFISLGFVLMWAYLKDKLKNINVLIASLTLLILIDGWTISRRYLNDKHFQDKRMVENIHRPTEADQLILSDTDVNYRVLNLASNTFNESNTSYFHKSVGGYSPAKLRRYQDIIDFYFHAQINPNIINMLNTRYIIAQNGQVQKNPDANGAVWFVDTYKIVNNPDEEILAIGDINLKDTAVIEKQYAHWVENKHIERDSNATIINTICNPNHLVYTTSSSTEQLATFSEVFYDKGGWISFIDGKEVPHFRVNYILRAMLVPQGEHTIEFKYVPHMSILGANISNVSSVIILLLFLISGGFGYIRYKKNNFTIKDNNA